MENAAPTLADVFNLLALLRRRIWIVIAFTLGAAVLAAAVAVSVKPSYRATTQVLIDPSVRQPFEDKASPARYLEDAFVVDSQVAVIQSYSVLRSVVTDLNLTEDPAFGGSGGSLGLLGGLSGLFRQPGTFQPTSDETSINKAVDALQKAADVSRDGLTFVINVTVSADTPNKAAILSNAIVEAYIRDQKNHVSNVSNAVEGTITDRLATLREQLRTAEAKVEAYKAKNNLQSNDQKALLTDQQLADLNKKLTEDRAALSAAEAKASEIERMIKAGADVNALTDVTTSTTIANLQQQYATAARTEANLSAELLPSHPDLIRARAQTEQVRNLIKSEVSRIASSAKVEADVLRDRVSKLEDELDKARQRSNVDQKSRIELQELQIEAQASKALYESLLSRAKEISEIDQIKVPNARIISPAVPPESAYWPKKKLFVLAGAVLGAMLGCLIAVGRQTFILAMNALFPGAIPAAFASAPHQVRAPVAMVPLTVYEPEARSEVASSLAEVHYLNRMQGNGLMRLQPTHYLLDSLENFRSGASSRDRSYWKSVFSILKQIRSDHLDGFATVVVVTSQDGDHGTAALSLVCAAANASDFRILLVDNNETNPRLTQNLVQTHSSGSLVFDREELTELGIDFLSLTQGRRKYQERRGASYQLQTLTGPHPEFDLIVISESPMSPEQIETSLQESVDHVVVSVGRPELPHKRYNH